MDEVFGENNFVIADQRSEDKPLQAELRYDDASYYAIWYCKDMRRSIRQA